MPDYSLGKIYRITSGDLTYIGSTTQSTLARRLAGHVKSYKRWKNENYGFTSSFPLIETGQYEITLIELWPCTSKDELTARERFHIESNICVNKNIAGRTQKEWCETNADTLREYQKVYREANVDTLRKKKKAYVNTHRDEINKRKREARAKKKSAV